MAYTVTNVFVDGQPTLAADVKQNIDEMRAYVNEGVSINDIVDGSIDTKHIERPELYPAPVQGMVGQLQSVWFERRGMDRGPAIPVVTGTSAAMPWLPLGSQRARDSLHLSTVGPDGKAAVPGMARRVHMRASGKALITAEWSAFMMYDNDVGGGGAPAAEYPGASGWPSGDPGGNFLIRGERVKSTALGSSNPTMNTAHARHIYPQLDISALDGVFKPNLMTFRAWTWATIPSEGVFDFFLEYNRDTAKAGYPVQIVFGTRSLVIEAYHD